MAEKGGVDAEIARMLVVEELRVSRVSHRN